MASADAMEREQELRRRAFLAAAAAQGLNLSPTPSQNIPQMTEAAGPIVPPEPKQAGFMDNLRSLGGMLGDTALSFVPGTQQSEDLSYILQTNPTAVPKAMIGGAGQTVSNIADLLPYIDTGAPGNNYAEAYRRGEGFTAGFNDLLNLLAAAQLAKAAKSATGISARDVLGTKPASAIAADPEVARMSALYEFLTNPDRASAIDQLPLPTGVPAPKIVVPSDKMLNVLDEGYKSMWEGGNKYVADNAGGLDDDYPDWRMDVEEQILGGKQPIYGFAGPTDVDKMSLYGGYSYDSPEWGLSRFPGAFWEIETRLNRPMTVTPGDTFSVSPEDVYPYQRNRIMPKEKLLEPDYGYNEVQIYGGAIPPEDIMNFKLSIIDPMQIEVSDASRLAMVDENLAVVKRLVSDRQPVTMDVYSFGYKDTVPNPSAFNEIQQTLSGSDVLDYLSNQQQMLRERIRRTER